MQSRDADEDAEAALGPLIAAYRRACGLPNGRERAIDLLWCIVARAERLPVDEASGSFRAAWQANCRQLRDCCALWRANVVPLPYELEHACDALLVLLLQRAPGGGPGPEG